MKTYTLEIKLAFNFAQQEEFVVDEETLIYKNVPFSEEELLSFIDESFTSDYIKIKFPQGYHIPFAIIPKSRLLQLEVLDDTIDYEKEENEELIIEANKHAEKGYNEYRN